MEVFIILFNFWSVNYIFFFSYFTKTYQLHYYFYLNATSDFFHVTIIIQPIMFLLLHLQLYYTYFMEFIIFLLIFLFNTQESYDNLLPDHQFIILLEIHHHYHHSYLFIHNCQGLLMSSFYYWWSYLLECFYYCSFFGYLDRVFLVFVVDFYS